MEYIFILFIFSCIFLIMQLSFTGKLHDRDETIKSQRELVLAQSSAIEQLRLETMSLRTAVRHYEAEIKRLENLSHG